MSEPGVAGDGGAAFDFRGVALVRRGDDDVVRHAGGTTGGTADTAISSSTRFQLASVSKQCTAAAVLTLVDRGALSVGDRLNGILPGGPATWDAITVHQLLTHTAGLVHWRHLEQLDLCSTSVSAPELLGIFAEAPLLHEPGTAYSYSSPGYVLLAHVVEAVSGREYRAFLHDELFSPLSMSATFAGNPDGEEDLATPLHDGEPVDSFELDVIGMGAGDVWSTVDDQATWDRALRDGAVLSDASRAAMRTAHAPVPDQVQGLEIHGYGYGVLVGEVAGRPLVFHTGDNAGFLSLNAWLADDGTQAVLLSNDTATDLQGNGMRLLVAALGL